MIKMTIFPSTSQPRAACTWARSWSSSRASTGMTTKPDSTTICSCASPRPTRSLSPTHPSHPTPTAPTIL